MSPVKLFHKYRGLRDFTLSSLLEAAGAILPRLVNSQTRWKVTDVPTKRTVRYYMTQGLVDRPLGRKGVTSFFSYRHLLQVLAVKYLQSQYLPLRTIKSMIGGRSNRELERLLPEGLAGKQTGKSMTTDAAALASGRKRAREGAETPDGRKPERIRGGAAGGELWRRHNISPGVALMLREDVPPRPAAGRVRTMEERIGRLLRRLSPGDGE